MIRDRVRGAVASELAAGGPLVAAARRAHRELDVEAERVIARDPSQTPACSAGCSYCCHVHADATRAEVLAIAHHLLETRSSTELAQMVSHLADRVRVVAAMDHDERWNAKIPCALLAADGTCSIHEVRPLRCRAFHSTSVDVCRDAFAGRSDALPDGGVELARACDAAERGYDAALEEHGISAEPLLLEPALLDALANAIPGR